MNIFHAVGRRKIRLILLAGLCFFTLLQIKRQSERVEAPKGMVIDLLNPPPPEKNSGGKVLGNPQNAIDDFKRIYQYIAIYKRKFKRYPPDEIALLNDMGGISAITD